MERFTLSLFCPATTTHPANRGRPGPLIRQGSAPPSRGRLRAGWVRCSAVLGSLEWLSGAIHGGIKTIRHAVTDSLALGIEQRNDGRGFVLVGSLIRGDDDDDAVIKSAAAASAATKMVNF